jgi:hypothetical protein
MVNRRVGRPAGKAAKRNKLSPKHLLPGGREQKRALSKGGTIDYVDLGMAYRFHCYMNL